MNKRSFFVPFIIPLLIFTFFVTGDLIAQVPAGFNFQAAARDNDGEILSNHDISVRISILEETETGTAVYTETHQVTTGSDGLFHLVIGQGDTQDDFASVVWSDAVHFVRLETDINAGDDYEELGTTRLFSVPYAMVAQNVIDGISVGEEPITTYHLNTSQGDTSFIINSAGMESLSALRINAETGGQNIGVNTRVNSQSTSEAIQVGYWSNVRGDAAASHYAFIGQANSKGRYNYGSYGAASGEGSGEIVPIGQESGGFFGSFNIGGGFYSSGNINGNLGVEGVASGSAGARINIGVEGRALATSGAENIGVNGFARNSTHVNFATSGIADGDQGRNVAIRGLAFNGTSNIGGYFHASDTAAVFRGPLSVMYGNLDVHGDITHTGEVTQTSDRNLKQNIRPMSNGLATIMQLRPVEYEFRGNGSYLGLPLASGERIGLIAQEVATVLPSLVKTKTHNYTVTEEVTVGPDAGTPGAPVSKTKKTMEYQTMNYTELIPVLIKAVQEQQEEIERLRDELAKMK